MVKRLNTGTVELSSKDISLDGIQIEISVVRSESGCHVLVDCEESKQGYEKATTSFDGRLHGQPYDPNL